ncbi:MAG: hypothetical protein ACI9V1_001874 [Spirosomataceae bacterium]|jgi:hypothetical protein
MSSFLKIAAVVSLFAFAPKADTPLKKTWQDLSDVEFNREFVPSEKNYFYIPKFGKSVLALNGKTVQLSGYFIPFNEELAVISASPMASCFFCGAAGPETMAEIQFVKKPKRYKTDQRLTIRGTFRTNKDDFNHLNYILKNAEVVE